MVPSIHYYCYFLRYDMMLIMNLLHAVSVIIVDAPIQNVNIVLTCTDIMAHGAQDTWNCTFLAIRTSKYFLTFTMLATPHV